MIKQLYWSWKHRHSPRSALIADYESLVRLARRCAYDLAHTVDQLPVNHWYRENLGMETRARYWTSLFAKGNPGKDYRQELQRDIDRLEHDLGLCIKALEDNKVEIPKIRTMAW